MREAHKSRIKVAHVNWKRMATKAPLCELLIVTAGFEDRALEVLRRLHKVEIQRIALIRYKNGPKQNDASFTKANQLLNNAKHVTILDLNLAKPHILEREALKRLSKLKRSETGEVWVDISALPTHGICMILKTVRDLYPRSRIKVLYTEATEYYPTRQEYERFSISCGGKGLENLPDTLTREVRETLILSSFAGFTIRQDRTCLFLFAGYEKHLSLGAIESLNPSKLVIMYGDPGKPELHWRYKLSRELHENLVTEVERAEECVSTLDVNQCFNLLDSYYQMLYDDYSLCIAPTNSKMQAVATYLVWEKYPDIQLCFPLPIAYLPERFSKGVGRVFSCDMPFLTSAEVVYGLG